MLVILTGVLIRVANEAMKICYLMLTKQAKSCQHNQKDAINLLSALLIVSHKFQQ